VFTFDQFFLTLHFDNLSNFVFVCYPRKTPSFDLGFYFSLWQPLVKPSFAACTPLSRRLREPFSYLDDFSRFRRDGFRSLAIFILLIADSGGL
jgi:hypothetical protein